MNRACLLKFCCVNAFVIARLDARLPLEYSQLNFARFAHFDVFAISFGTEFARSLIEISMFY